MAFWDVFLGNSVERHARRLQDRNTQPEDREKSADWLAKDGSDGALLGLLGRYNLQLEHSIKDQKEKELVFGYLVEHGAKAAKAAREFSKTSVNFQGAVRLVEKLEGTPAALDLLLDLLAHERVDDEFKPEKKKNLLIALAERRDPRIVAASTPYMEDFDEGVRNAAVEAIAAQDPEQGRGPLCAHLCNPKEESTRIRGRIAELAANRRWELPPDEWLTTHIPPGYRLIEGRLVAGR